MGDFIHIQMVCISLFEDYFLLVWNYLTDLSYFKLILWKNKGESVLCMEQ